MRNPDLKSPSARAWVMPIPPKNPDGSSHSTIKQWLVKGPFHPFWDTWIIAVIHLRPLEGYGPPHLEAPDRTHEFLIFALDPGAPKQHINYDPDAVPLPLPILNPIDACVQFRVSSDEKAALVCDEAVKTIIAGAASPDSDFRSFWKRVIPATARQKEAYI